MGFYFVRLIILLTFNIVIRPGSYTLSRNPKSDSYYPSNTFQDPFPYNSSPYQISDIKTMDHFLSNPSYLIGHSLYVLRVVVISNLLRVALILLYGVTL